MLPFFCRNSLEEPRAPLYQQGGCFSFPLCSHKKSQRSEKHCILNKFNYLHTGIYLSDEFSVKRGSLRSGKSSESPFHFPWKDCRGRKEKDCGKTMHFLGATHNNYIIIQIMKMQMYVYLGNPSPSHLLKLRRTRSCLKNVHNEKINCLKKAQNSLTHLSAILTHIGLTSYHRPDVVIQPSIKRDRASRAVTTQARSIYPKRCISTHRIFRRILFTTSSILAKDWGETIIGSCWSQSNSNGQSGEPRYITDVSSYWSKYTT